MKSLPCTKFATGYHLQDIIDVIDCINSEKTENQTLKEEKSEITPIQPIKIGHENSRNNNTAGKLSIVSSGSM